MKEQNQTSRSFKYYQMSISWAFIHCDMGVYHSFPWLRFLFLLSLIICAVLLISHTILTEMEECISAIANHIDPLVRSPHPNLLTPDGKQRQTHLKSPLSAIFWPLHSLCPITAINTIGHSSTFWCALSSSSRSLFSISRFFILTMPSTVSDVSVPSVYSSCSATCPHPNPGIQFSNSLHILTSLPSIFPSVLFAFASFRSHCPVYTRTSYQMHRPTHICHPHPQHTQTNMQTHTHMHTLFASHIGGSVLGY